MRSLRANLFAACLLTCACVGCAIAPLKGGRSSHLAAGVKLQQPQNPATPATQDFERVTVTEFLSSDSGPATNKVTVTEKSATQIGAAQNDPGRAIAAKAAAMRPVQLIGIGLIVAAIGAWWLLKSTQLALGCIAGGTFLIVLAQQAWVGIAVIGALVFYHVSSKAAFLKGRSIAPAPPTP